jgi:hypothetical protein
VQLKLREVVAQTVQFAPLPSHYYRRNLRKSDSPHASFISSVKEAAQTVQPESTDKGVMKGKDRLGDGSANWQFAPLDQRSLCQALALSSVAAASTNV